MKITKTGALAYPSTQEQINLLAVQQHSYILENLTFTIMNRTQTQPIIISL